MTQRPNLRDRAESGDADAQFELANMYWPKGVGNEVVRGDIGEALMWLRKAAEQDHVQAQSRFVALVGENNIQETLKLLQLAAEKGNSEAAMERCYCLVEFLGDEEEAIKWYRIAIAAGHPHSGHALGIAAPIYRDFIWGKRPIPPNEKIPRERRLARAGDPTAQYRLGALFVNGAGVSLEIVQAYAWFAVAARPGLNQSITGTSKGDAIPDWGTAARAVRVLEQVMEDSELEMAKILADDYLSRFGGGIALEVKFFYFTETCVKWLYAIAVVLPVLMLRSVWTRFCPPKTDG